MTTRVERHEPRKIRIIKGGQPSGNHTFMQHAVDRILHEHRLVEQQL